MMAIVADRPGGPEVLNAVRRPVPRPGPGELLLQMHAAGVNRPDLMQRSGAATPPAGATDILGLEVAGTVVDIGENVAGWRVGERVMALLNGGGYAEYCLARADVCLPVPEPLSWTEAGALPEGAFTVWHNLFERGALRPGDTVLVHGGASGIGTLAVQLAAATGARAIATAGSTAKLDALRTLGATHAINYRTDDFVAAALQATDGRGVDVVLDIAGGDTLQRNLVALAPGGRHVSLSFMNGPQVQIDLRTVMQKGLVLTSSTLRPMPPEEKARIARAVRRHVLPLVAAGRARPFIHAERCLTQAADAHAILEASANIGKVVLRRPDTAPPSPNGSNSRH
ncbi:NAD(P)H-quinone oxidoreductase [Variovorax sp. RB2P76]|uniref:NAD(P)H-quinone oxidoreductase n=1 Tax=Variovorax sp. RB2P76 TaxID=3443736 RepID=UPI003F45CE08